MSNQSGEQRVCHVIKREDFDGYGFNLHAEKGKPGQYIGKVDDDSPAEAAGLKQGDRIIEVNGVNIGNETHKQVVQRIKAIACEVRLLVEYPQPGETLRQASDTAANDQNGVSKENSQKNDTNGSNASSDSEKFGNNRLSNATPTSPITPPPPQSNKTSSGETLNLKMTAAELRAKLASKKKYDPKADTVDLRKKYDIVQKL